MKSLINYQTKNPQFYFKPITYRFKGIKLKRKGIDIFKNDILILSLEPVFYSNGDKWFVKSVFGYDYQGKKYLKRITKGFLDSL